MDSRLVDRFQRDMTDMLRRLRAHPAQILWRSYSPSHFGGAQGSFILDKEGQGREQQDKVRSVPGGLTCQNFPTASAQVEAVSAGARAGHHRSSAGHGAEHGAACVHK